MAVTAQSIPTPTAGSEPSVQAGAAVAAAPAESAEEVSIRSGAIRGSVWTIGGYGAAQTLRLGSNLVLTRLLVPEHFGLMTMVNVCLQGLQMFSDLGLGASIVQNRRGLEPSFLNTAWTISVLRGMVLFAIAVGLTWPLARFYDAPELLALIPVAAVSALIQGFSSTAFATFNRRLMLGKVTLVEIGTQAFSVAVMIIWALISPSVWALVAGGIAAAFAHVTASHLILADRRDWFGWDRDAAHHLIRFGRWIFLSTALGFIVSQGDRLILGKVITLEQLGVYSIAFFLANAGVAAMRNIGHRVLFPVYSRLSDRPPDELRRKIFRTRAILLAVVLPGFCAVVIFGQQIVQLLYDPRYWQAGWILQILAAKGISVCITGTLGPVLLALGDSYRFMLLQAVRSVALVAAMLVGSVLGGFPGLVIGVAVTELFAYPVMAWAVRSHKLWMPRLDLYAALGSGLIIVLGLWLTAG
jgi:O-antigen/teichoic acid export membrane protein